MNYFNKAMVIYRSFDQEITEDTLSKNYNVFSIFRLKNNKYDFYFYYEFLYSVLHKLFAYF